MTIPTDKSPAAYCTEKHWEDALSWLRVTGDDLHTECSEHDEIADLHACDGVHCHRKCTGTERASCRRMLKMRVP